MKTDIAYIYGLYEPESERLRYVGASISPLFRFKDHLKEKYQNHKCNWIQSLKKQGHRPLMRILEVIDFKDWDEIEKWWITTSRLAGFDLVNGDNGGTGWHGNHTEEFKLLKSQQMKEFCNRPEWRRYLSERNKNYKHTEEQKRKIGLAQIGRKDSEETKLKRSSKHIGMKRSEEARRNMSKAMRERFSTEQGRQHIQKMVQARLSKKVIL